MTDSQSVPGQPPPGLDPSTCSGCNRTIYWIKTPRGKNAPIDPEGIHGWEVTLEESRTLRTSPAFVQGLDRFGAFRRIMRERPTADEEELFSKRRTHVVWVNHYVTCPKAERFRRPR